MRLRRKTPEIIAGAVSASATLVGATDPNVHARNSAAGVCIVTFPRGFHVLAMTVAPTNFTTGQTAIADNVVTVTTNVANTGAGNNTNFTFIAVGYSA